MGQLSFGFGFKLYHIVRRLFFVITCGQPMVLQDSGDSINTILITGAPIHKGPCSSHGYP